MSALGRKRTCDRQLSARGPWGLLCTADGRNLIRLALQSDSVGTGMGRIIAFSPIGLFSRLRAVRSAPLSFGR